MNPSVPRMLSDTIERQAWLDPLAKAIQRGVKRAYETGGSVGQTFKNFVHGVWLGHPLHPVLTDIPIGAFTAATVLDGLEAGTRQRAFGTGADTAVALGVTSAAAAALAGLTDYQHVSGNARRVGLLHGLLNVAVTGLYAASWLARRRRRRAAGRRLGLAGYALAMAGGYLGGKLVFDHHIGVNHAHGQDGPDQFVPVLPVAELAEGRLRRAEVQGTPLVLVRRGEHIYALAGTCAHLGGPLAEGWLVEDSIVCPWHQSRFRLPDGQVLDGPSTYSQPCLEARVRNGQVEVRRARPGRERAQVDAAAQATPPEPRQQPAEAIEPAIGAGEAKRA